MFFDSLFDQPRGVRGGFDPWEQQRRQALAERRAEAERRRQADMRLRREMFERERQRQADERAAQAQRSSSSSSGGGEESGEEAARRSLPPRGFPSRRPGFPWGTRPVAEAPFSAFMPSRTRSTTEYQPKTQARPAARPTARTSPESQPSAPPAPLPRRVPKVSKRARTAAVPPEPCEPEEVNGLSSDHTDPSPVPTPSRSPRGHGAPDADQQAQPQRQRQATPPPQAAETAEPVSPRATSLAQIAEILKVASAIKETWAGAFTPIASEEEREQIRKQRAYFEEGLLQQVIKLDGVDACGDPNIRMARKNAVVSLEKSVAELKAFADRHDFDKQALPHEPEEPKTEGADAVMRSDSDDSSIDESEQASQF